MGKRRSSKSKAVLDDDGDENPQMSKHTTFTFSDSDGDDDDAEANEDLSLQIVEKARLRAHRIRNGGEDSVDGSSVVHVVGGGEGEGEDIVTTELVAQERSGKKKRGTEKKEKKKKRKKLEPEGPVETVVKEEENNAAGSVEADVDLTKTPEQDDAKTTDNAVLKRLLRGPRYFDPPDSSWGTCYNCGEEGHSAVNCTSARRKKPCFICGSFEHGAKQCDKGQNCFICKETGHRAKACPQKYKKIYEASEMCLKCGISGHVMSSCNNDYPPDDLKGIQCYVCKNFGHLCCVNYSSEVSSDLSCYKCGQLGHSGIACRGSNGETTGKGTQSSCYRCGEEGHFARECTNSSKVKKRNRDLSTPKKKYSKEEKGHKGYKSAPQDLGKFRKKKKLQYEEEWSNSSSKKKARGGWVMDELQYDEERSYSSSKKKARGGWVMDEPSDFPRGKSNIMNGSRSPVTPTGWHRRFSKYNVGSPSSTSWSERKPSSGYHRAPDSQGPLNSYQHRYSASRFGSSSISGMRRNYDWW